MLTLFKVKCRMHIEATLSVPATGYFVKNHRSMRLCYIKEGCLEYINLATIEEIAEFLKKHGIIHYYSCKGEEVAMYAKRLVTSSGWECEPIQKEELIEVQLEDIELSPAQVQTFAAAYEVEHNSYITDFIKQMFYAA